MRVESSTAIITGGASGLGAASARMIVAGGGSAVILDVNEAAGEALAAELGPRAMFVRTDVADPAQTEAAVAAAASRFGGVRILINCAGTGAPGRVVSKDGPMPLDRFERIIRINLIGTFNAIRL